MLALRRVTAAVLTAVAAFTLVASVVGLWGAATTLNTNRWVATAAPLPRDPAVAAAVSRYATDQLFDVLDVGQRMRTVLPPQAAFVVGPLTTQMHEYIQQTVDEVVRGDRFQKIWVAVNRRAHEQAMAIINGTSTVVAAQGDNVRIDLLPLINQVLRLLTDQLPTLFGRKLTLPDINSGEIPADLRIRVQDLLGVALPANFAQFTIYNTTELRTVQRTVVTFKRDLAALVLGTLLLLVLALLISPGRRRTVLQLGIWLVVAAVTVTASLRAARGQVLQQIPDGVYRDGVAAALTIVTATLRVRGTQLIWLGLLLAVVAYLVGPGRVPVWLRRHVAIGARAIGRWTRQGYRAVASRGPAVTERYLDAIRIGGIVVAVVLALLLPSWTALLVIAVVLAVFEIGVTLIGRAGRPTPRAGVIREG
ncbi:MAG: hypothetical protein AUI14_08805 [Actinobacteria bacterium 13_2_20CM_2_71_6]|nr:MAG: hypothetical protein AUI14_08805 [Actinobacteria bacterium 13_2_20CM_2_71_6]